jgi:tetratricopeptide (TPR) repeat protein
MVTIKNRAALKPLLALLCLALAAGCKPPGPKALSDGKRLLDKGRVPEAIDRLRVATDLMATNAQAWNYLGVAFHEAGQTADAANAYKRALAANPDLIEARLNLGMLWMETGRPADAKSEFTAYSLRRPNAPEGFQKLATAELELRDVAQAEVNVRKALKLDPEAPASWNTLGLVQLQRGRTRDAAQSFSAALQRQPDFAPGLLNLAVVTQQYLGDRPAALKLYQRYLGLKPRPADADSVALAAHQLEVELKPVRPATVSITPAAQAPVSALSKPLETNRAAPASLNPPTLVAKAESTTPKPAAVAAPDRSPSHPSPAAPESPSKSQGSGPSSEVTVTKAATATGSKPSGSASVVPEMASTSTNAEKKGLLQSLNPAGLFKRSPKPTSTASPSATEVAVRAESQVPVAPPKPAPPSQSSPAILAGVPRYHYQGGGNTRAGDRESAQRFLNQGAKAFEQRNFPAAADAFKTAAGADPSWYQAHFNHATAALEAGRIAESLAAGESALSLKPDSAEARYTFALALKRGNYVVDSAAEFEKLVATNPNNAGAHLALGNLYAEQLRQTDKARTHYLRVLEIDPQNTRAGAIHFWLAANPKK